MNILIVSQYFWPESFIINDIVKLLRDRDHQIVIATGKPNYPEDKIFDWYAGSLQKYKNLNINDFLCYNVLSWGSKNGYNTFDFGGAGKANESYGVRDHKMKFGGDLVEFGRFENIHKPFIYKISRVGLSLYKLMKKK